MSLFCACGQTSSKKVYTAPVYGHSEFALAPGDRLCGTWMSMRPRLFRMGVPVVIVLLCLALRRILIPTSQAYATKLPNGQIHVFPIQYNTLSGKWLNYWKSLDGPGTERSGRVPHVRQSVRGTKTTRRSPTNAFSRKCDKSSGGRIPPR